MFRYHVGGVYSERVPWRPLIFRYHVGGVYSERVPWWPLIFRYHVGGIYSERVPWRPLIFTYHVGGVYSERELFVIFMTFTCFTGYFFMCTNATPLIVRLFIYIFIGTFAQIPILSLISGGEKWDEDSSDARVSILVGCHAFNEDVCVLRIYAFHAFSVDYAACYHVYSCFVPSTW